MNDKTFKAGVDVGGTKTALALVAEGKSIVGRERLPTPQEPAAALDAVVRGLIALLGRQGLPLSALEGVGLSFPAKFEEATGLVLTCPNIPRWIGLDPRRLLAEALERELGFAVPVAADNDTCAAVLGEGFFGAGRGLERLLYFTVSTGVGGSRLVDGRPTNLEPGMSTFPDPERPDLCLEELAGGAALARRARIRLEGAPNPSEISSVLSLPELAMLPPAQALLQISARHLALAADGGDAYCRSLIEDSARLVAETMRRLLTQGFEEQRVVVGGSIALKTNGYMDLLRRNLATAAEAAGTPLPLDPEKDLVAAELGDDVSTLGATLLL